MGQLSLPIFVKNQWAVIPEVEHVNLEGRNVIVTGSNTGLGYDVAKHFASMKPAKLIIAVRSTEKGEQAKRNILEAHPSASVEVWQLDLASFASVKAFAARVKKDLDRLDLAVLNAGISNNHWATTGDGYEQTLQVNDISTGLLAVLLLPLLEETAKKPALSQSASLSPHLCIVASEVHFWSNFSAYGKADHPVTEMNDKSKFVGTARYNDSKLLNVFITREIAKRASPNVVVNCVNPGLCHSELTRGLNFVLNAVVSLLKAMVARTTEVGSRTIVWAAMNKTKQGAYSSKCIVEEESDYSLSPEGLDAQKKVWADLVEIWKGQDASLASLA